jgi:hypothetical protein
VQALTAKVDASAAEAVAAAAVASAKAAVEGKQSEQLMETVALTGEKLRAMAESSLPSLEGAMTELAAQVSAAERCAQHLTRAIRRQHLERQSMLWDLAHRRCI